MPVMANTTESPWRKPRCMAVKASFPSSEDSDSDSVLMELLASSTS